MGLYIAIGVAAVIAVAAIVYTILRAQKINKNGIETDAVVSRIKENETREDDGTIRTEYIYYVTYADQNGNQVEAKLGNAPRRVQVGMALRIKYLPEKPKFVLAVKQ